MAKYSVQCKITVHAKDDRDAQAKMRKLDELLQKHGRTLLTVEGIILDKVTVEPKITKEP